MTGYDHAVKTLAARGVLNGHAVEIVGDSLCASHIFRNGGSQAAYDPITDELPLLEALLSMFETAAAANCVLRFRWVRRDRIQHADDLSKYTERFDCGLTPPWREHILRGVPSELRASMVDRFAAPHNAIAPRYNALHDSAGVESVDAFAAEWGRDFNYLLPPFNRLDCVLDKVEADDAAGILVVPVWLSKPWWRRLQSGAWAQRASLIAELPPEALTAHEANRDAVFFGREFASPLHAYRLLPCAP